MENFKYDTLNYSLSQIRLIHLLPQGNADNDEDGISCKMETVSLRDPPEFTALSYAWGNPSRTSLLIIDDKISHITQSVEIALLYLRHETDTITLWIDQLCINQDDNIEKSEQVQLMQVIYRDAKLVIAWLGPTAEGSDGLLDLLSDAGKEASASRLMQPDLPDEDHDLEYRDSYNRLVKRLGQAPTFPIESLRSFVHKPYWTRVWIVQELSLAQEVVFACGKKRISYIHLRHALQFFSFYIGQSLKDLTFSNNTAAIDLDPEKLQKYLTLLSAPMYSATDKMLAFRNKYVGQIEKKSHELIFVLRYCNVIDESEIRLDATNPRDRIYGLLGLTKDALGIRPNYSDSIAKVYTDVARALITSGHIDLLCLSQFPRYIQALPTWAPDWSAPIECRAGFGRNARQFCVSGKRSAVVTCTDDLKGVIIMEGTAVDEVAMIVSAWIPASDRRPNDRDEDIDQYLTEIDQYCNDASHRSNQGSGIYAEPRVLEEARWRTPIGDREHTERNLTQRATERSRDGRQDVLRRIEMWKEITHLSQAEVGPFMERFHQFTMEERSYRHFMREMGNRRPFRSQKGYVGLGPLHMLPNDVVCILLGSQVPYILRPYESHGYQLVGEAYIHGIMDGEYVEKEPMVEKFALY